MWVRFSWPYLCRFDLFWSRGRQRYGNTWEKSRGIWIPRYFYGNDLACCIRYGNTVHLPILCWISVSDPGFIAFYCNRFEIELLLRTGLWFFLLGGWMLRKWCPSCRRPRRSNRSGKTRWSRDGNSRTYQSPPELYKPGSWIDFTDSETRIVKLIKS